MPIADPDQLRPSDAYIKRAAQGVAGFDSWRRFDGGVAADLFFSAPLETIRPAPADRLTHRSPRPRIA
jgi:hypothetical protein